MKNKLIELVHSGSNLCFKRVKTIEEAQALVNTGRWKSKGLYPEVKLDLPKIEVPKKKRTRRSKAQIEADNAKKEG
jgi:hypothetical protein